MPAHISIGAHAGIAKTVGLLGIHEKLFHRLFALGANVFANRRFYEGVYLIRIVLAIMPRRHISLAACCKALVPLWTRMLPVKQEWVDA